MLKTFILIQDRASFSANQDFTIPFCEIVPWVFSRSEQQNTLLGLILRQRHSERAWPGQHSLITPSPSSQSHSPHLLPPTSVMQGCIHSTSATAARTNTQHGAEGKIPQTHTHFPYRSCFWCILQPHRGWTGGPDNLLSVLQLSTTCLLAAVCGAGRPGAL